MSINLHVISGRLTKEPEINPYTDKNGQSAIVTRFCLAVDRNINPANALPGQPTADFFNCVAFGKKATWAATYLHKGTKVIAVGDMQNDNYLNPKTGTQTYGFSLVIKEVDFASDPKPGQNPSMNNPIIGMTQIVGNSVGAITSVPQQNYLAGATAPQPNMPVQMAQMMPTQVPQQVVQQIPQSNGLSFQANGSYIPTNFVIDEPQVNVPESNNMVQQSNVAQQPNVAQQQATNEPVVVKETEKKDSDSSEYRNAEGIVEKIPFA